MSYQPTLKKIRCYLAEAEKRPELNLESVQQWMDFSDVEYLIETTSQDWVMIYLNTEGYFANSFFIESQHADLYKSPDANDLNAGLSSSVSSFVSDGTSNWLEASTQRGLGQSRMLPLIFSRSFEGYPSGKRYYYEILQTLLHVSGVHWVESRKAYCDLNEVGDIEERIVLCDEENFTCILVERYLLDLFMGYGDYALMRFFEVKRHMGNPEWLGKNAPFKCLSSPDKHTFLKYRPSIDNNNLTATCDMARASNLILPRQSISELEGQERKKSYESFIIQDWKNDRTIEWSSDPDALDNYFVDTGKPFTTSPAYFKAEVLLKYKSDPEKYELGERHIHCRGAWYLKTYDINDEGQVHTYICYLGDLPDKEQLHWKQFNEKPKGKISERAWKTDFKAEWVTEYNPLAKLKEHFRKLSKSKTAREVWQPKEEIEELLGRVHYVSAGKLGEYKDFLLALTILVVDGLQESSLRTAVQSVKGYDRGMKSLGLLRLWLISKDLGAEEADRVVAPLKSLQAKRSKFSGHGGAKPDFDLIADAREVLEEVERAIAELTSLFE